MSPRRIIEDDRLTKLEERVTELERQLVKIKIASIPRPSPVQPPRAPKIPHRYY